MTAIKRALFHKQNRRFTFSCRYFFIRALCGICVSHAVFAQEIIVKFKTTATVSSPGQAASQLNNSVADEISRSFHLSPPHRFLAVAVVAGEESFLNVVKYQVSSPEAVPRLIDQLSAHPQVEWVEPNYRYPLHLIPDDSLYNRQWALHKLGMENAWDIQQGLASVIVGVIDTGIDMLHPDLRGQIWVNSAEDLNGNGLLDSLDLNGIDDDGNGYIDDVIGWDFTDAPSFPDAGDYQNPDNDPADEYPGGHGTPVAGIIAARTDNQIGVAGIAPGIKVMNLRAATASGYLEADDVAEAILYGTHNGAKIINMSFGDVAYSRLIKEAVDYAMNRGVICVASAGNSGTNLLQFPAGYDNTIAVGATGNDDQLAPFSSFGSKVDLVAPGQEILAPNTYNGYSEFGGTSFSAPMVCGVLALLWSNDPLASAEVIKSRLLLGCRDLGAVGWDPYYGHGVAKADNSLRVNQTAIARIDHPATLSGVFHPMVPIVGTATGSNFKEYMISYGAGDNPLQLIKIFEDHQQVVSDTLGWWDTRQLPDSLYTLQLTTTGWDRTAITQRVLVFLDRTAPVITGLEIIPVLIEDYYGFLILAETDDPTIAKLFYRNSGQTLFNNQITSGYFEVQHAFMITQLESRQEVEFWLEVENSSGKTSRWDNGGAYYHINLNVPDHFREEFKLRSRTPGSGYFLGDSRDFNADGYLDVIGNLKLSNQNNYRLGILNLRDSLIVETAADIPAFGRDVMDVNRDGIFDLLAGYGNTSYLFNGIDLPGFSGSPAVCPETDFWAARIFDLNNDQHLEVLALHNNQWNVYRLEDDADFTVSHQQVLDNPTAGENAYGIPYIEIGDMNNNGITDFLLGDYDGDLLLYEVSPTGDFRPAATIPSGKGRDATHLFAAGDILGDGQIEIALATQVRADSPGENSAGREYWMLTILRLDPAGNHTRLWQQNFFPLVDGKNLYSGLTVQDYDHDGKDEIFFTPYPRAYYIQYEAGEFQVNWYLGEVNSNAVPLISSSEVVISGPGDLMIWENQREIHRPLPPAGFRVEGGDSSHLRFSWMPVAGADGYRVSRLELESQILLSFWTTDDYFYDQQLIAGHSYSYSVQTQDSSYLVPLSEPTRSRTIKAENPPRLEKVEVIGLRQLSLTFDKPLGEKSYQVDCYRLLPGQIRPVAAIRGKANYQIVLGFLEDITPGQHEILLLSLENSMGVPFFTDSLMVVFTVEEKSEKPYLQKIELISKKEIRLYFNHPMDIASVEDIDHYRIEPDDAIIGARRDEEDPSRVRVFLEGRNRLGNLGTLYYLEIRDLKNVWGAEISTEFGNRFLIQQSTESLERVIVFPNPFRGDIHPEKIVFGNLPPGCEIFIYNANGQPVKELINEGYSGGIEWNITNQTGEPVKNGVYIYIARFMDLQKTGKFLIIR